MFNIANNNSEALNELSRLFWLSRAHFNVDCYFGFKYNSCSEKEMCNSDYIDIAINTPRVRIDSNTLDKMFSFISRFKLQKVG